MNNISKVKIEDKENDIKVIDAKMCEISVNGSSYIVPYPVADLVCKMSEELEKEQKRKRKDDEEIKTFIKNTASHIAYALCGGDKDSMAYYGENLLGHEYDYQVSLPKGWEFDDGSTTEDFGNVVARRIIVALRTNRSLTGNMEDHLNGSRQSDVSLFTE